LKSFGRPIVATSCNMTGKPEDNEIEQILEEFREKVDCIIDGGTIKEGVPSTIIKIEDNTIKILRPGIINKQEIERRIKE